MIGWASLHGISISAAINRFAVAGWECLWPSMVTGCTAMCAASALANSYTASDLYALIPPSGFIADVSIDNTTSGAGQVASLGLAGNGNNHAIVWSNPGGGVVDLHPTLLSGFGSSLAQSSNGAK